MVELEKYKKRLCIECMIKSFLISVTISVLVMILLLYITSFSIKWYAYVMIGVFMLLSISYVSYMTMKPTYHDIARRVDKEYRLREKASTMLKYLHSDGVIVRRQRQDAIASLESMREKDVKIRIPLYIVIPSVCSVLLFIGMWFIPDNIKNWNNNYSDTIALNSSYIDDNDISNHTYLSEDVSENIDTYVSYDSNISGSEQSGSGSGNSGSADSGSGNFGSGSGDSGDGSGDGSGSGQGSGSGEGSGSGQGSGSSSGEGAGGGSETDDLIGNENVFTSDGYVKYGEVIDYYHNEVIDDSLYGDDDLCNIIDAYFDLLYQP